MKDENGTLKDIINQEHKGKKRYNFLADKKMNIGDHLHMQDTLYQVVDVKESVSDDSSYCFNVSIVECNNEIN